MVLGGLKSLLNQCLGIRAETKNNDDDLEDQLKDLGKAPMDKAEGGFSLFGMFGGGTSKQDKGPRDPN
jgi:hypothetical protein